MQYQELLQANKQLQESHDNNLRDNFEVTEFLRREITLKDEKIASLQGQMEDVGVTMHYSKLSLDASIILEYFAYACLEQWLASHYLIMRTLMWLCTGHQSGSSTSSGSQASIYCSQGACHG